jgi:uncharacterized protein (DUF433 family)
MLFERRGSEVGGMDNIDWRQRIAADPGILAGKPAVRGTRLSVEHLLGLFAAGWDKSQVLESYPQLSPDDLAAVFAYAADLVGEQRLLTFSAERT